VDKRDNYFETRIRAARAQINQRTGSFSLSRDLVFGAGARLLVGCAGVGGTGTKPAWGRRSPLSHRRDGGVSHHGFPGMPGSHPRPTAKDIHEHRGVSWWLAK